MPAAWIGFAQRSISAGRYLARYSGVRRSGGTISRPSSSSRARMAGSSRVSLIALLSLRTIGSGVPLGRKKAFQTLASTPGRPCSPVVATSGMIGTRFCAITAMALTALLGLCRAVLDGRAQIVDAAADQVLRHRPLAAIRNVRDVGADRQVEQHAGEMRPGADAGRAEHTSELQSQS